MFTAISLLTPFFRLHNEKLYKTINYINFFKILAPHRYIERPEAERPPEYLAKWGWFV
jgi:hypothetical protein